MSRSALWRQEGNQKERQRQAEELFQLAVDEGRNNRVKNLVPMWGPDDSFHLNPMLLQNIIKSSYFQKCCRDITDWNTLVDEIYYEVKHLEPWALGSSKDPSAAFCLLLRLLTLRCTEKQMKLLLDHVDSPYIRAIGFLFLRYAGDPKCVWSWIEPYLYDEETVQVEASGAKHGGFNSKSQQYATTIGDYVRRLFTERNYFGTIFPRLPIQIERDIQVKLLQAEKMEERAQKNMKNPKTMAYFQKVGSNVMALYGDDENPIQWYSAVVDRVIKTNEDTGQRLRNPKFIVTFPEYGNTETVSLGEMEMPGSALKIDSIDDRSQRGGGSDYNRGSSATGRDYDRERGDRDNRRNDRGYANDGRRGRGYDADRDRGYNADRGYNRKTGYGDSSSRGRGYDDDHGDDYDRRDRDYRRSRGNYDGDRHRDDRWQRGGGQPAAALPSENDLYEEVRRRERATVTSNSRNAIARRPPNTKTSMMDGSHDRHRRPQSPDRFESKERNQKPRPAEMKREETPAPRKRTAEELAAIQEKKRKLMAKYG